MLISNLNLWYLGHFIRLLTLSVIVGNYECVALCLCLICEPYILSAMSEGWLNSSLEQLLKYPSLQWFFSYTDMPGATLPIDVHLFGHQSQLVSCRSLWLELSCFTSTPIISFWQYCVKWRLNLFHYSSIIHINIFRFFTRILAWSECQQYKARIWT